MADDSITVNLTVTANQAAPRVPLKVPKDASVTKLRELVSETTKIPLAQMRLIFRGRLLADDPDKNAVEDLKLEEGSVLHCMGKPAGGASGSAAPASAASAAPTASGSSVQIQPPSAASAAAAAPTAAASANPLQAAFNTIRSSNPAPTYLTAVTTLEKILSNIVNNPMEEKYRRVKKNNAAFQKRLGGLTGGDAAMKAAGFVAETNEGEEVYMMHASAEKWPELMRAKAAVELAAQQAKAASNQASSAPPQMPGNGMPNFGNLPGMGGAGGGPGMGAGLGGFPGMGGPGMGGPGGADMQAAAARMMSDPQALSAMMSNPMVQNMMRNDPRFANNPMLQQSIEQLANNPQMAQQISQMMQDPNMQRQMQAMMGAGGAGGGEGGMGGFPGMPPGGMPNFGAMMNNAGAGNNNNNAGGGANNSQQQQGGGGNDDEQTEEEMIAEAIRRSLQDGN